MPDRAAIDLVVYGTEAPTGSSSASSSPRRPASAASGWATRRCSGASSTSSSAPPPSGRRDPARARGHEPGLAPARGDGERPHDAPGALGRARRARARPRRERRAHGRRAAGAARGARARGGDTRPTGAGGERARLRRRAPPIPILLGASGPRMLELAVRIGDGCLAVVGLHPRQLEAARARLGRRPRGALRGRLVGADRRGDDPDAGPRGRQALRRTLTPPPATGRAHARRARGSRADPASYEYRRHLKPGAHADLVPDEIVADWAVAGTPADCREQLAALELAPGERIGLVPMGPRAQARAGASPARGGAP